MYLSFAHGDRHRGLQHCEPEFYHVVGRSSNPSRVQRGPPTVPPVRQRLKLSRARPLYDTFTAHMDSGEIKGGARSDTTASTEITHSEQ